MTSTSSWDWTHCWRWRRGLRTKWCCRSGRCCTKDPARFSFHKEFSLFLCYLTCCSSEMEGLDNKSQVYYLSRGSQSFSECVENDIAAIPRKSCAYTRVDMRSHPIFFVNIYYGVWNFGWMYRLSISNIHIFSRNHHLSFVLDLVLLSHSFGVHCS